MRSHAYILLGSLINLPSRLRDIASQLSLDVVKKLFDWVQPRGVLRIQKYVRSKLSDCLVNGRVLVNTCVVHKYHYLLVLRVSISAQLVEGAVQKVIEDDMVSASLCYLGRYNTVLSESCY